MTSLSSNTERYPSLTGIVKLQGGEILLGETIVKQDLWFDSGLKKTDTAHPDEGTLYHQDDRKGGPQIISAKNRFWEAGRAKDYSAHMIFDITGLLAVPGYIDIQTNGAFGLDYTTPPEFDHDGNICSTAFMLQTAKGDDVVLSTLPKESFTSPDQHHVHDDANTPVCADYHVAEIPSTPERRRGSDLRAKPNIKSVQLNLVNKNDKINPDMKITATRPIDINTPQMSRTMSTANRVSMNGSLSTNSTPSLTNSLAHTHHNTTLSLPHFGSVATPQQTFPHFPQLHYLHHDNSDTISIDSNTGLATTLTSNIIDNYSPSSPSPSIQFLGTIRLNDENFYGDSFGFFADDTDLIKVGWVDLHPNKARSLLNALQTNGHTIPSQLPPVSELTPPASSTLTIPNLQVTTLQPKLSTQPTPLVPPQYSFNNMNCNNSNFLDPIDGITYPFDHTAYSGLLNHQLTVDELRKRLYQRDRDMLYVNEMIPKFGVTSICPTIISSDGPTFAAAGKRVVEYMLAVELAKKRGLVVRQCNMLGLHLEGPFISVPGAHNKSVLGPPKDFHHLSSIYNGDLLFPFTSIVTLAPELDGALDVTDKLSQLGIVVSMGHSMATVDQAKAGINNGATLVTHMFNAMRAFHHRDPGLIGILGATEPYNIHFSIIADGYHAHPFSVNIAHSSSPDKLILVTDSMAAMGLPDGHYKLGTQDVTMDNLKAVLTHSPQSLAGAVVPLDQCVRNFVRFTGCSKEQAILAATRAPAELLGMYPRKGSLLPGADADIVLLDPDTLEVVATIVGGQLAYVRDDVFPRQPK